MKNLLANYHQYKQQNTNIFHCVLLFIISSSFILSVSCVQRTAIPLHPMPDSYYENKIKFNKTNSKEYSKTNIKDIKIYKNINHFLGQDDSVHSDELPVRPYEVIGILAFDEEWYFASTLEQLINQKVGEIGGDAILLYETYQVSAARIKRQDTGKIEDLYLMKVEATVIKYSD